MPEQTGLEATLSVPKDVREFVRGYLWMIRASYRAKRFAEAQEYERNLADTVAKWSGQ